MAGIILVVAGMVWALQGLDVAFVPESAMTGDLWWVIWGATAVVVGIGLLWWDRSAK
jgi:hypothetical protein